MPWRKSASFQDPRCFCSEHTKNLTWPWTYARHEAGFQFSTLYKIPYPHKDNKKQPKKSASLNTLLDSGPHAHKSFIPLICLHSIGKPNLKWKQHCKQKSVFGMCRQCLRVVRDQCVVRECVFGMCRQCLCVVRGQCVLRECVFGMCRQCLRVVRDQCVVRECVFGMCRQCLCVVRGQCVVRECVFGRCRQCLRVVSGDCVVRESVFAMCRQWLPVVRDLLCLQRARCRSWPVNVAMCRQKASSASVAK